MLPLFKYLVGPIFIALCPPINHAHSVRVALVSTVVNLLLKGALIVQLGGQVSLTPSSVLHAEKEGTLGRMDPHVRHAAKASGVE